MSAIDLDAIARSAAEQVATRVLHELPALICRALDERTAKLETLAEILGISDEAAVKRLQRDPGLRALGVPDGKRLKFQRDAVYAYQRGKQVKP